MKMNNNPYPKNLFEDINTVLNETIEITEGISIEDLYNYFDKIDDRYRSICEMRYKKYYSYKQISKELGVSGGYSCVLHERILRIARAYIKNKSSNRAVMQHIIYFNQYKKYNYPSNISQIIEDYYNIKIPEEDIDRIIKENKDKRQDVEYLYLYYSEDTNSNTTNKYYTTKPTYPFYNALKFIYREYMRYLVMYKPDAMVNGVIPIKDFEYALISILKYPRYIKRLNRIGINTISKLKNSSVKYLDQVFSGHEIKNILSLIFPYNIHIKDEYLITDNSNNKLNIEYYSLSSRACNILLRRDISIDKLKNMSDEEISNLKNVGIKTKQELINFRDSI